MMTSTIYCRSKDFQCPYYVYCIARRADPMIIGCGMYLYAQGYINYNEVGVTHAVRAPEVDNGKVW